MLSLIEVLAKHGLDNHAKLSNDDLQKNIKTIDWNKKLGSGEKTVYPSSRSKTDLKSATYKINNIERRK